MNRDLNYALVIRMNKYRNEIGVLPAKRKAKEEHLEYLQEQINVTWSPFKRLRLLQEMVELMNVKW